MSILDDVRIAIVENDSVPRGVVTIHHPNCALLKPDAAELGLSLLDCSCGGALLPARLP